MNELTLDFMGDDQPELSQTRFCHLLLDRELVCIRGKTAGAYAGCSTFQWTKAVQALALLVIRSKAQVLAPVKFDGFFAPHLIGGASSLAASLDYALDKQTTWLLEMFGWDRAGIPTARRIIHRTNPGRKRPGPVALSFSRLFLEDTALSLSLNSRPLTTLEEVVRIEERIRRLETPPPEPVVVEALALSA